MQSISKAWNYIKQNKWKVMGATAAVAGGLWYWTSRSTRNAQQEAHQKHSYWLDAQLTCDRTISAFAPMLLKRINEILKIPELLEDLRKPDLDKTEKINKWEQLKTASAYIGIMFLIRLWNFIGYLFVNTCLPTF
jgi:hypothetical protein